MGDTIRTLRLISILTLAALAACTRNGPPAPVEVKSQQYYGRATSLASVSRPTADGAITVQRGDTVYALARKHDVSPQALIDANHLSAPYALQVGQRLSLPRAQVPPTRVVETIPAGSAPPAVPAGRVDSAPLAPVSSAPISSSPVSSAPTSSAAPMVAEVAKPAPAPVAAQTPETPTKPIEANEPKPTEPPAQVATSRTLTQRQLSELEPASAAVPARAGRGFVWPVRGRVVSDFGPKGGGMHNDGINIAAAQGTPIRAAESGVVVYAGNELRGFGNLVLLRHADGWMTAYGHAEELTVQRGDQVKRGQVIGRVGATGNVTSPQVHFELRRGSRPVNPREHLLSESASAE
jgi:murein DD-endopeptidase MepM/ murein hydrolase activator NlpD